MDFLAGPWNTFLVHPLLSLLVYAYGLFRDFGFAIVAVTVGIRLLLYPLFVVQIRSQRVMQEIAPAMNEIRQKYGNDRQKVTEEQLKLYRERGYNPASGCFPILLQMPILFAMYAAFLQAPELTGDSLSRILWPFVENPLAPDQKLDLAAHWLPWISEGLGARDPIGILPILAGATQLVSSVMAMPAQQQKVTDPQARMMQQMAYYFPLITVFIAWGLPAGLSLYWVATTVFQVAQQYVVTGWGQLARWLPFLHAIPTPADRTLAARQQAAVVEANADMKASGAKPSDARGGVGEAASAGAADGPGAQYRPTGPRDKQRTSDRRKRRR
jgi:YidC/Oxa1 family membrane protein insertase